MDKRDVPTWRDARVAVAMIIALASAIAASRFIITVPAAASEAAGEMDFSAGRALAHVTEIARTPRPSGTQEDLETADYIVGQIQGLGLKPEIQETSVESRNRAQDLVVVHVRNILTRIQGSEGSGGSVLLVAHYDSVPGSPGAADDAAGVSVLLETMRALQASAHLPRDIMFLFTDAEEVGCYGAKAFVAEHPWSKEVAVALNFEARGTTGPAIMFQTGNQDGWLVGEFMRAAPGAYANSLASTLFKVMPNATDFGVLRQAGISGLNFAFAEGWQRYHSGRDTVENLDARSVQHEGNYALAMARRFGAADLSGRPRYSGTYFNLGGPLWIFYRSFFTPVLSVLILFLYGYALYLARKRRELSWRGAALSAAASLATVIAAAFSVRFIIGMTTGGGGPFIYASESMFAAVILGSLTFFFGLVVLCRKRANCVSMSLGAMALWMILMVLLTIVAPEAAYIVQWPALLACVSVIFLTSFLRERMRKAYAIAGCAVCGAGIALILAPSVESLHIAFPIQAWWILAAFLVLCLLTLVPQLDSVARVATWRAPAAAVAIAAVFSVMAARTQYDDRHPRPNHVFYIANADSNTAMWLTRGKHLDEWTEQFFPNPRPIGSLTECLPDWYTGETRPGEQAIIEPLQASIKDPPEVSIVSEEAVNGVRRVLLRVRSPRGAPSVSVRVYAEGGILSSNAGREKRTEEPVVSPHKLVTRVFSRAHLPRGAPNATLRAYADVDVPRTGASQKNPLLASTSVAADTVEASDSPSRAVRKALVCNYFGLPASGDTLAVETRIGDRLEVEVIERSYNLPAPGDKPYRSRPGSMFQARSYVDSTIIRRSFTF
jgi:hypothetical protein